MKYINFYVLSCIFTRGDIEIYRHRPQNQIPKEIVFFYRSVCVHMIQNLRGLYLFIKKINFAYMDISVESSVGGIYQNVSEENRSKDTIFGLFWQF